MSTSQLTLKRTRQVVSLFNSKTSWEHEFPVRYLIIFKCLAIRSEGRGFEGALEKDHDLQISRPTFGII